MPIKIFYHIYTEPTMYEPVVREQMRTLLDSGILAEKDARCYMTILGPDHEKCKALLRDHYWHPALHIQDIDPEDTTWERVTLLSIHDLVGPEDAILYFHSKGVRLGRTDFENENIQDWRRVMELFLLRHYRVCLQKLASAEAVGGMYSGYIDRDTSKPGHFIGNFWWTTGAHYLSLPRFIGENYLDPEYYLLSKPARILILPMPFVFYEAPLRVSYEELDYVARHC
jgi:hypothetical protein